MAQKILTGEEFELAPTWIIFVDIFLNAMRAMYAHRSQSVFKQKN